jgi:hypothetical protein
MTDIKLNYANLRALLDAEAWANEHGIREVAVDVRPGEGHAAALVPDGSITIHDHPGSGRPREIHFMVDGVKIAEFGPPDGSEGVDSDVAPGYIDFLGEWDGQPVHHVDWKNRIMADNGLLPAGQENIDLLANELHDVLLAFGLSRRALILAGQLADAVIAAHTVHVSYSDALVALENRDRS